MTNNNIHKGRRRSEGYALSFDDNGIRRKTIRDRTSSPHCCLLITHSTAAVRVFLKTSSDVDNSRTAMQKHLRVNLKAGLVCFTVGLQCSPAPDYKGTSASLRKPTHTIFLNLCMRVYVCASRRVRLCVCVCVCVCLTVNPGNVFPYKCFLH